MPKWMTEQEHYTIKTRGIIPKEGGILGVWISSLTYGIILSIKYIDNPYLLAALIGAIAALPATGLALNRKPGRDRAKIIIPIGILFLPLVIDTLPDSIYYLIPTITLLVGAAIATGLSLILIGGPLVSAVGGALALANGNPIYPLLPLTYSLMTVALAGARVTGRYKELTLTASLGGIGVLIAALALSSTCTASSAILILDVLLRLAMIPTGLYERLSLKQYGFHELFRSLLVLGAVAMLCT